MRSNCIQLLILSILTFTWHPSAQAADDLKLREILNRHWEAIGGNNWLKVESLRLNGTIERNGRIVDICIVKKRPNQIRATVTIPIPGSEGEELQVIRAHDGKTAWTATRIAGAPEMVKEELPPEAATELLADAGVLPPLIKLWQEGAELKLSKPVKIHGVETYHILAQSDKIAGTYNFYLSTEDFYLLRHEYLTITSSSSNSYSEYKIESGIAIPAVNIVESIDTGRTVIRTRTTQVGVGIHRDYFNANSGVKTTSY